MIEFKQAFLPLADKVIEIVHGISPFLRGFPYSKDR